MKFVFLVAICCVALSGGAAEDTGLQLTKIEVPDLMVTNQDGQQVHFKSDLIGNKTAVINSIFTTCTTVCLPMGANFSRLQKKLGDRAGRDVVLISISIDPENDTAQQLKAWGAQFHAGPGWTLVTGSKPTIDHLLKALGLFAAERETHSSSVLIGNEAKGWTRANALASPDKLLEIIDKVAPDTKSAAENYFTDVTLIDQDGQTRRLYTDLLKGKTVVIDGFFTGCKGSCPLMTRNFVHLQDWLGDRLGREVNLLSISVDPVNDTPARLKNYAEEFGARPGWYFLSGDKEKVDFALKRLGEYVEQPDDHLNLFLIGNEPTELWKKVFGMGKPESIIAALDSVMKNQQ
jgi:protein SCO1